MCTCSGRGSRRFPRRAATCLPDFPVVHETPTHAKMAAKSSHFHLKMEEAIERCRADCQWERQLALVGQMRARATSSPRRKGAKGSPESGKSGTALPVEGRCVQSRRREGAAAPLQPGFGSDQIFPAKGKLQRRRPAAADLPRLARRWVRVGLTGGSDRCSQLLTPPLPRRVAASSIRPSFFLTL